MTGCDGFPGSFLSCALVKESPGESVTICHPSLTYARGARVGDAPAAPSSAPPEHGDYTPAQVLALQEVE